MYVGVTKVVLIVAFILSLVGCSNKTELAVNEIKRSGVDAIIMDNSAKVTYIKEHKHIDRFCASRGSDVEQTSSQGLMLGLSSGNQGENIGEDSTNGALSLGGRSPVVLLTRELMYRACELTMNLNTNKKDSIDVYKMFLDSIKDIASVEHDLGSTSVVALPKSANKFESVNSSFKKMNDDEDDEDKNEDDDEDKNEDDDEDEDE